MWKHLPKECCNKCIYICVYTYTYVYMNIIIYIYTYTWCRLWHLKKRVIQNNSVFLQRYLSYRSGPFLWFWDSVVSTGPSFLLCKSIWLSSGTWVAFSFAGPGSWAFVQTCGACHIHNLRPLMYGSLTIPAAVRPPSLHSFLSFAVCSSVVIHSSAHQLFMKAFWFQELESDSQLDGNGEASE